MNIKTHCHIKDANAKDRQYLKEHFFDDADICNSSLFDDACRKGSAFVKVAIVEDAIVGFAVCHSKFESALNWADVELTASLQNTRNAYVELIEVDMRYRRNGLGKLLLESVETVAKTQGKTRLWLHVRCSNKAAVTFYMKLGWAVEELQHPQWMEGADVFLLSKRLL